MKQPTATAEGDVVNLVNLFRSARKVHQVHYVPPVLVVLLMLTTVPVEAGFRFGLGNAVAKRSAELINKAGDSNPPVGDEVAALLPACPAGTPFTILPTDMNMIGGIDPLGHVQPTGHTFPTDHIYYYSSTTTAYTPPVYAPGDIHITEIDSTRYLNASPIFTDYALTFYACSNLRGVYAHVRTLTADLQSRLSGGAQRCTTYSTGGSSFERCEFPTDIALSAGDLIGYVHTSGTLDFGMSDTLTTPIPYVSPNRRGPYQLYTVCPIDYFTAGPKATMEAKLGRFDGGYRRVTAPICGTINQDVANTAKGYWYHPGSPDSPEDPHLALIDNNVYAPKQTISVGNALTGGSIWYIVATGSSGFVNRDFSQVTSDGNIYCYDAFFDPLDQALFSVPVFLIQMPTATTLKIERSALTSCGSGPWTFGSNAVTYQR